MNGGDARMLTRQRKWLYTGLVLFGVGLACLVLPPYANYCDSAHQDHDYGCAPYEIFSSILSLLDAHNGLITAIATGLIAWFTLTLRRSTEKLWNAGERQLSHLESTAKKELRAYIVIQIDDLILPANWQADSSTCTIRIIIKNTGRTPAHDLRTVSRTGLFDYPFPIDYDFTLISGEDPGVGLLGPGEPAETECVSDPFNGNDWLIIRHDSQGSKRLCTYGTVTQTARPQTSRSARSPPRLAFTRASCWRNERAEVRRFINTPSKSKIGVTQNAYFARRRSRHHPSRL